MTPPWLKPDLVSFEDTERAPAELGEALEGTPWAKLARQFVVSRFAEPVLSLMIMDATNPANTKVIDTTVVKRIVPSKGGIYLLATTIDTPRGRIGVVWDATALPMPHYVNGTPVGQFKVEAILMLTAVTTPEKLEEVAEAWDTVFNHPERRLAEPVEAHKGP